MVYENKTFKPLIYQHQLENRIVELAKRIDLEYLNVANIHFLIVLKGAFPFAAKLLSCLKTNYKYSFCTLSSYSGMQQKDMQLFGYIPEFTDEENIIILEDIVDTGATVDFLLNLTQIKQAKSCKIASLLFKPKSFSGNFKPDYVGFDIENKFVIGFGLDINEQARDLDQIYQLVD